MAQYKRTQERGFIRGPELLGIFLIGSLAMPGLWNDNRTLEQRAEDGSPWHHQTWDIHDSLKDQGVPVQLWSHHSLCIDQSYTPTGEISGNLKYIDLGCRIDSGNVTGKAYLVIPENTS